MAYHHRRAYVLLKMKVFPYLCKRQNTDMDTKKGILARARLLLGDETMERIGRARVIIFGVGGVGSWCAESLVRSGIRHLTIVDSDRVCVSNINRQLMATVETVGQVKVDVLKERLLLLNPDAEIDARRQIFNSETAESFGLDGYDYIIDAIDSLQDKLLLIEMACRTKARFFSSMGAALKLDPTRIRVTEFWKVQGCPLARALRQRFKKKKSRPVRKFLCVYSDELLENKGHDDVNEASQNACTAAGNGAGGSDLQNDELRPNKTRTNGSLMHITATFGLTIAGLVIQDITKRQQNV